MADYFKASFSSSMLLADVTVVLYVFSSFLYVIQGYYSISEDTMLFYGFILNDLFVMV